MMVLTDGENSPIMLNTIYLWNFSISRTGTNVYHPIFTLYKPPELV